MINIKTYQSLGFNDLIERIWFFENTENDIEVLTPPSQYLNLIFPINGCFWKHNNNEIKRPLIEGMSLQSSLATYPKNTKLVGIRFYPFGLASFSKISGNQLVNKTVTGNEIIANEVINEIGDKISIGKSDDEILLLIDQLLHHIFIPENYKKTELIRGFYQYFRLENHTGTIEEFSHQFNTNYTTLNRRFSDTIGISAKRFERLIKFRKALCSLTDTSDSLTSIGADSGYFDQSHFIREFKLFMNHSPKAYNALIRKADKETNIINYNFNFF